MNEIVSWKNHVGYSLEIWQYEFFWISGDIYFPNNEFTKHGLYIVDVQMLIQEHRVETQKGYNQNIAYFLQSKIPI